MINFDSIFFLYYRYISYQESRMVAIIHKINSKSIVEKFDNIIGNLSSIISDYIRLKNEIMSIPTDELVESMNDRAIWLLAYGGISRIIDGMEGIMALSTIDKRFHLIITDIYISDPHFTKVYINYKF